MKNSDLVRVRDLSHSHVFDEGNYAAERGTRMVMWITAAMMVVEVVAGWWFNSMALLADGWHMSSHAVAIGLSAFAYAAARRYQNDARFAFGTWKIEILGGFASAIFLLFVAAMMVWGSLGRLISPQPIDYRDAITIAVAGLLVNMVSALILGRAGAHEHEAGHHHGEDGHHAAVTHEHQDHEHHDHDHDDHHHRHDLNLKSAYLHVLADAATSVLAIVALSGGLLYGWSWLDPAMGLLGSLLVAAWARNLLRDTGKVLLDREMDHPVVDEIRKVIEISHGEGDNRIADLHVWRVGRQAYSCAVVIVTRDPTLTAGRVREWLADHEEIVHATIEIHQYEEPA